MPPAELEEDQGQAPGATERQWEAHLHAALPELAVHAAAEHATAARAEPDTAVADARGDPAPPEAGSPWPPT